MMTSSACSSKAGLPDMRFHDLRHSAASLMLAQGIPLRSIQDILGHSSIALTANLYAHVGEQLRREAGRRDGRHPCRPLEGEAGRK